MTECVPERTASAEPCQALTVGTGGVSSLPSSNVGLLGIGEDGAEVVVIQGAVGFPPALARSWRSPNFVQLRDKNCQTLNSGHVQNIMS